MYSYCLSLQHLTSPDASFPCATANSTRRYDEAWGAGERADTRLKCSDGVIHNVHSQVLSLWSSVLRNMIVLIPGPQLLESTQGLAYVLNVEESSNVWGAVLDMMYPILRPAKPGPPTEPVLQRAQDWVSVLRLTHRFPALFYGPPQQRPCWVRSKCQCCSLALWHCLTILWN